MASTFVFIFVLVCFFNIELNFEERELPKLKRIVNSIHKNESYVIDGVDIYQQHRVDHQLLKDHKILTQHPHIIKIQSKTSEIPSLQQKWHENGKSFEGAVPTRKSAKIYLEHIMKSKKEWIRNNASNETPSKIPHEYVVTRTNPGTFYGTKFATTVWNPHVEDNELSLAQTWIMAGPINQVNIIEVGWMVYPRIYGDSKTHFFIFVTLDGYKSGFYNLDCPGFTLISEKLIPGMELQLLSTYGHENVDVWILVYKIEENWWVQVDDEVVGYWDGNIFPHLSDSANLVGWGGEITNARKDNHHTKTEMGSGHFAIEKFSKAALFHNLQVKTNKDDPDFERPEAINPQAVTNSNCYSFLVGEYDEDYCDHFFYGGPGYSESCP